MNGTERVLVVEDDPMIQTLMAETLIGYGYEVLVASNGWEAMPVFEQMGGKIDLLLTDVLMPKMGGQELARRLRMRKQELRVLFISGYPVSAKAEEDIAFDETNLLPKPFSPIDLLTRVRQLLDAESAG